MVEFSRTRNIFFFSFRTIRWKTVEISRSWTFAWLNWRRRGDVPSFPSSRLLGRARGPRVVLRDHHWYQFIITHVGCVWYAKHDKRRDNEIRKVYIVSDILRCNVSHYLSRRFRRPFLRDPLRFFPIFCQPFIFPRNFTLSWFEATSESIPAFSGKTFVSRNERGGLNWKEHCWIESNGLNWKEKFRGIKINLLFDSIIFWERIC